MLVLVQVVCSGVVFAVALMVAGLMLYHLGAAGMASARSARSIWRGDHPGTGALSAQAGRSRHNRVAARGAGKGAASRGLVGPPRGLEAHTVVPFPLMEPHGARRPGLGLVLGEPCQQGL
jgi:hypothetical protein